MDELSKLLTETVLDYKDVSSFLIEKKKKGSKLPLVVIWK